MLAALLVTLVLAETFTVFTYLAFTFRTPGFSFAYLWPRIAAVVPAVALAVICYCTLFGGLSLLTRRTLVAGGAYIVLIEGVLANIDFALRRLTIVYYFRVLVERLGGASKILTENWSIDLASAPTALACIVTLASASGAFLAAGMVIFSSREYRLKTPEGN
jgi:hypothetical protein